MVIKCSGLGNQDVVSSYSISRGKECNSRNQLSVPCPGIHCLRKWRLGYESYHALFKFVFHLPLSPLYNIVIHTMSFWWHSSAGSASSLQRGPANSPSTPSKSPTSTHDILGMYISQYPGVSLSSGLGNETWKEGMDYGIWDHECACNVTGAAPSRLSDMLCL